MRLTLLSLGLLAGYFIGLAVMLRDRRQPSGPGRLALALVLGLAATLAVGAMLETTSWYMLWRKDWFEILPLDAAVAGLAVGLVLAEQRAGGVPGAAAGHLPSAARPGEGSRGDGAGLLPVPPAAEGEKAGRLPTFLLGAALGVLLLFGALPRSLWADLLSRTQSLSASPTSGVSVSFGQAETRNIGRAIQDIARPLRLMREDQDSDAGFAESRLDALEALAGGLNVPPDRSGFVGSGDIFADPVNTGIVLSRDADIMAPLRLGVSQSHYIARDRAIFWRQRDAADPGYAPQLQSQIRTFATGQEMFLVALRQHVACIGFIVRRTEDQRLLEYQNIDLISRFVAVANALMELEFERTRRLVMGPGYGGSIGPHATQDLLEHLGRSTDSLQDGLNAFVRMTPAILGRSRNFRPQDPVFKDCSRPAVALPDLASTWIEQRHMVAPYVQIFAAYLLSAVGDNIAAVRLLAVWLDQLNQLEHEMPDAYRMRYGPMTSWLRLRVLTEMFFLQRLSEHSDNQVPVRAELLRHLIFRAFPSVLPEDVTARWTLQARGRTESPCRAAEEAWRQPIVISRYRFAKEYIDFLVANDILSRRITEADVQLAASLLDLDLGCFERTMSTDELARQRALFVSTFASAVIAWGQTPEGQNAPKRLEDLFQQARREVRDVMNSLSRLEMQATAVGQPNATFLVHGNPRQQVFQTMELVREGLEVSKDRK